MEDRERKVMEDRKIIEQTLSQYIYIPRFFGDIINKRLNMPSYEYGMLTFHLLNEQSEDELEDLEMELEFGYLNCAKFEKIFQKDYTSQYKNLDMQIKRILAQIKGMEVIFRTSFKNITKAEMRNIDAVDFTAQKYHKNYAIVIGLGLTQTNQNQHNPVGNVITSVIYEQYPRLNQFCQNTAGEWNGIIVISTGYDYLTPPSSKNISPTLKRRTAIELLRERWTMLKEGREDYPYLSHLILIDRKWNIYPSL